MDTVRSRARVWRHRTGEIRLGLRTVLMGVVNVTPDSFSDGGRYLSADAAVEHALQLERDGADLLDLGAESTRPGSEAVSADDQLGRLLPVLERLRGRVRVPLSVDTTSATVAERCLRAGVSVVNDVSGFHREPTMAEVCASHGAGVVLMHIRGAPKTMQAGIHYDDLFGEIRAYLAAGVEAAERSGIPRQRMVVDPGLGFGKTFEQNYQLIGGLRRFGDLAAGVLAGPSRKAFTGEFSGSPPDRRQFSTAAAVALCILNGADVVRVHDVCEMRQAADIIDRYRQVHEPSSFHD
jgi:dihydropteroate synthase